MALFYTVYINSVTTFFVGKIILACISENTIEKSGKEDLLT